jgi:hypothetical protein
MWRARRNQADRVWSKNWLDFSFIFLNVTDFKGIRAGGHFRSGQAGEITIRQPLGSKG